MYIFSYIIIYDKRETTQNITTFSKYEIGGVKGEPRFPL